MKGLRKIDYVSQSDSRKDLYPLTHLSTKEESNNMTICIAVICENGKKIVIACDRMVTVGDIIEFEHDVTKFESLTDTCVVMTSGSTTLQNDVIKQALMNIKSIKKPSFQQVTESVKEAYVAIRTKRAEELYLKPINMSYSSFFEYQKNLVPEIVFQTTDAIKKAELGVEFILCGFDDNGGHIHYLVDPGTSECYDAVGFWAIGTGSLNAISLFTSHSYAPNFSIGKSIYLAYLAKKEAERAPGVGNQTDIAVLTENGMKHLDDKIIKGLSAIQEKYKKIGNEEYEEVEKIVHGLDDMDGTAQ